MALNWYPRGHRFRVGDRVIKVSTGGDFNTRPSLPRGAMGTIAWAGERNGHFPHVLVLLDRKWDRVGLRSGWEGGERCDFDHYRIPVQLQGGGRWHVCPIVQWKYVGRRINPAKIYDFA